MGGYVVNFTVYTMAMIGLICFAVFVYKKITDGSIHSKGTNMLGVEESMSLSPRKTLHIVRAGKERFLIASDIDKTTLISKLNDGESFDTEHFVENEEISQSQNLPTEQKAQAIEIEKKPKDRVVHLEPINLKSEDNISKESKVQRKRRIRKDSDVEFSPKISAQSPMKEIAKRINEL